MGLFERSKLRKSFRKHISKSTYDSCGRSSPTRKSSFSRPGWMKKLGSSFDSTPKPIKDEVPKSPNFPITPNLPKPPNPFPTSEKDPSRLTPVRKSKTLPVSLNETPNLEHIVHEFESGFVSPNTSIMPESGNFVKKIVAAIEEKYKSYNDSRSDRVREKLKDSGLHRHSYTDFSQSKNFTAIQISQSSTETLSIDASRSKFSKESESSETPKFKRQNYPQIEPLDSTILPQDNSESSKGKDGAPFIIGAFLKKPIKVDETSINWIPFPGKKLPRKKSLKKLLSTLSGKKTSEKKNEDVFSSQVNINEDNRELPDSGYDEKSTSTSSLTSSASSARSTPDLPHQEAIYVNLRRAENLPNINLISTNLPTFQAPQYRKKGVKLNTFSATSKKILLHEVPREELKVDLGPAYPSPSEIMVKSLDRRVAQKEKIVLPPLPKHPAKSRIPKHPFISLSKDELNESNDENEKDQIRDRKDHLSSFNPSGFGYDVPKKFLSKSESGIMEMLKFTFDLSLRENTHYDVPKLRPKSSVYDEALSLKRRTADLGFSFNSSCEYYSSPCDEKESPYATIKSRNRRYNLKPEIFRSTNELRSSTMIVTV